MSPDRAALRWIVIGVGAAMLAALTQSMVDSVFLGQDTAFLFWTLLSLMLLLLLASPRQPDRAAP